MYVVVAEMDDDIIIHLVWVMEEYVITPVNVVWFKAEIAPMVPLMVTNHQMWGDVIVTTLIIISSIGIFKTVNIVIRLVQLVARAMGGNHMWNGATPILVNIAVINSKLQGGVGSTIIIIIAIIIKLDLTDWMIKYLKVASADKDEGVFISGINIIMAISSDNHKITQFIVVIDIMVKVIIIMVNAVVFDVVWVIIIVGVNYELV